MELSATTQSTSFGQADQSASINENSNTQVMDAINQISQDFWQEITAETSTVDIPLWRMWR